MGDQTSLTNTFLIAMPGLDDPFFSHTVTYICEHSEQGAMGIVINRPSELMLSDVLDHMGIPEYQPDCNQQIVYAGGPVEKERGFVLHNDASKWDSSLSITEDISITTSRDILSAIADNKAPERTLVALGYAGWTEGQLESELQDNAWLHGPANLSILFDLPPSQRWEAAAMHLGVDLNLISPDAGHA